jgi:dTDP-4-dehydrorhamnose reductase
VVSDQLRTPTYVGDICKGIQTIIDKEAAGAYHFAGKDVVSPYEMALATAKVVGLDAAMIEKVTADTFPEPVIRAKRSGLKIEKAQRELGYEPVSFEEGVRLTFGVGET